MASVPVEAFRIPTGAYENSSSQKQKNLLQDRCKRIEEENKALRSESVINHKKYLLNAKTVNNSFDD